MGAAFGRRRKRNSSLSVRKKAESGAVFYIGRGRDFFSKTAIFFLPGSTTYHADVSIFPLGLQCLGSAGETPPGGLGRNSGVAEFFGDTNVLIRA